MGGRAGPDAPVRGAALLLALTAAAFTIGGSWTYLHPSPDTGYDLGDIPLGQALISAGAVLILLRFNPTLGWFNRIPGLSRLLAVINARAITIYLTHNIAITVADPIDSAMRVNSTSGYVGTVAGLIVLSVPAFGWVEDVAARRPVRLIPGGNRVSAPVERRGPVDPTPRTAPIPLQMPVRVPGPGPGATTTWMPAPRRNPRQAAAGSMPGGRPLSVPRHDPRQTARLGTPQGRRRPPGDGAPTAGGWL